MALGSRAAYVFVAVWGISLASSLFVNSSSWSASITGGRIRFLGNPLFTSLYAETQLEFISATNGIPILRSAIINHGLLEGFGLVIPNVDSQQGLYEFPLWPAITTLIPFVVAARLFPPASARRVVCRNCQYDLCGNSTGICSECGTPIPDDERRRIANSTNH